MNQFLKILDEMYNSFQKEYVDKPYVKNKIVVIVEDGICRDVITATPMEVLVLDYDRGSDDPLYVKTIETTDEPKEVGKRFLWYQNKNGATSINKEDPTYK